MCVYAGKTVIDKALDSSFKELANTFVFWSCVDLKTQVSECRCRVVFLCDVDD
jgi:hypothetical protein